MNPRRAFWKAVASAWTTTLVITFCMAAQPVDLSVPDKVSQRFMSQDLWKRFEISERINPFYLRADFDGDNKPDYVVLVVEKGSRHEYLALVISTESKVRLYPRRGRDFGGWTVADQKYLTPNVRNLLKPLRREAFVMKFGGPGILEYWDGKDLKSEPFGD